jgi:hypothetical protein
MEIEQCGNKIIQGRYTEVIILDRKNSFSDIHAYARGGKIEYDVLFDCILYFHSLKPSPR